jgi:ATP-dependent helicase/nuclease subunit A
MSEPADAFVREAAARERDRNVLIDASAGTGKTSLVVSRVLNLVAPCDGADAIEISRIAVITFTRKAAGELRFRIRQRILSELAAVPHDHPRHFSLRDALGGLDAAYIGTIHSFADRLLRLFPHATGLDPAYEMVDDNSVLIGEALQQLIDGNDDGTLPVLLAGTAHAGLAEEVATTILDLQRAGLRLESFDSDFWTYHGLDGLVAAFVESRDVEMADVAKRDFDRTRFERFRDEYIERTAALVPDSDGARWLLHTRALLELLRAEADVTVLYRELVDRMERGPRGRSSDAPTRNQDFASDAEAWDVWKAFVGDNRQEAVRPAALRDDLLGPLREWMAVRLVRVRPVVLHLYELVKARHRVVDQIDLLLKLRDLLRDQLDVRGQCQQLFDHIFVDEFQDTDPLQAECVLFLCEETPTTRQWDEVLLAPGKLTIVGDPKQSIYRFRRADIATYRSVCDVIRRSPHASFRLSSSFRTAPALIDWINDRFASVLGLSSQGESFRESSGDVYYHPLTHGRAVGPKQPVRVVPFELAAGGNAAAYRELEATTIARYIRWMTTTSGLLVTDPLAGVERSITYSDVAILAVVTTNVPLLFDALDRDDIPYSARGGSLFLQDPLHQQFLLGVCSLADPDDGVAMAALLRPPFFKLSLGDLARARSDAPSDPATEARAIVTELRQRRFERGPGTTARALLEQTAFGRSVAIGANGAQRLANLRDLCFEVERRAIEKGLDYDATCAHLRTWIDSPVHLDPPHPVGTDAVRILTVHQAKGLEFPVVVMWDGRGTWNERIPNSPFEIDRTRRGWSMRLDSLRCEEPPNLDLAEREQRFREAERKRLIYVAATRARDFLVVPQAGEVSEKTICGTLIGATPLATVATEQIHRENQPAQWFVDSTPAPRRIDLVPSAIEDELEQALTMHASAAMRARHLPLGVTSLDIQLDGTADRIGRFGPVFGETVHRAIGHAVRLRIDATEAVRRAACATGLIEHHDEAVFDVARALKTLAEVLPRVEVGPQVRLEYPVCATSDDSLVVGYIDLIATSADSALIIDFKTDVPPSSSDEIPQAYRQQLKAYQALIGRPSRAGLLFTADGVIRWL